MLCFFLDKTTRNEQWEVGIEDARFLEPGIHEPLNMLPDGIAVRPDNHAAAHRSIVSQFCLTHYLVIPLRKIIILVDYVLDIPIFINHFFSCGATCFYSACNKSP